MTVIKGVTAASLWSSTRACCSRSSEVAACDGWRRRNSRVTMNLTQISSCRKQLEDFFFHCMYWIVVARQTKGQVGLYMTSFILQKLLEVNSIEEKKRVMNDHSGVFCCLYLSKSVWGTKIATGISRGDCDPARKLKFDDDFVLRRFLSIRKKTS